MHACIIAVMVFVMAGSALAQTPISFSGKDSRNGAAVAPDSVYVLSDSGTKDTTLISGMSLNIDWLTSVPIVTFLPDGLQLGSPFPNGFDVGTQFDVRLERRTTLTLDVCNTLGKRVVSFEQMYEAGTQRFRLDASALTPGVYFLRASDGRSVQARKLLKIATPSSAASTTRLIWMGMVLPAGAEPQLISEVGKAVREQAVTYTFIGYAAGFLPDTLAQVTPTAGRNYEFTFIPSPDSRKIRSGRFIDEERSSISTGGGTVTISRDGSPINGLSISIPAGSYKETREFSIAYAAVEGHDLGQYFQPISPLITIGNGGGYSDQVMKLTIPVEIPAGHFAMAWLYNERTGEVEALPPLAQDAHSITVMTRHFATSTVSGLGKRAALLGPVAHVVVTSLLESKLTGQEIINTGFQPGRDDWEFVNHGSVIAPRGHCAGQSITAMWYYYEQRLQATPPLPALFGAYDRVNESPEVLWMDNREGYRFASVIQEELDFDNRLVTLLWEGMDSSYHSLSWKAFGMAMLVTGCPQYVGLTHVKADGNTDGGHAIIAYKQSFTEGKLYVADPNYPGALREIRYDAQEGYFTPYSTKQNADEADERAYQNIGCFAKSALIEWDRVTARWPEFLDGTIGSTGAKAFPSYKLELRSNDAPVQRGDTIHTLVNIGFKSDYGVTLFYDDGRPGEQYPILKSGKNTIGVYIHENDKFIDFLWVDVIKTTYTRAQLRVTGLLATWKRDYIDSLGLPVTGEISEGDLSFQAPLWPWGEFSELTHLNWSPGYKWEKSWSSGDDVAEGLAEFHFVADSIDWVQYEYKRRDDGGSYLTADTRLWLDDPIRRTARFADRDEYIVTGTAVGSKISLLEFDTAIPPLKKRDTVISFKATAASRLELIMFK